MLQRWVCFLFCHGGDFLSNVISLFFADIPFSLCVVVILGYCRDVELLVGSHDRFF